MPRTLATLLGLATLSAAAPLFAQTANSAGPVNTDPNYSENYAQPPAPIERPGSLNSAPDGYGQPAPQIQQRYNEQRPANTTSEPVNGVWLVSAPGASVQTVSSDGDHTELRVDHGRANVNVEHPAQGTAIDVDLPGGQVALIKDGLYTFNADTNTVRVLHGEAEITVNGAKPVKVKENHEFVFGADAKEQEVDRNQLSADLLQGNYGSGEGYRHGDGYGLGAGFYGGPYAYGWPYYGFYGPGWGYPYYAFGGPFWGYPYSGFGLGLGFGYYGGFRGGYGGFGGYGGYGGFRGGYGGFRR